MFEREIKFIYDFNLNKVNRLGPYFTFEQLSTADIHPAILHYISAEIDFLVFEDRQKLLKNSVFDYSGEKISYNFMQITEELKKTKRFSLEYIAKLILHASSFTINYLIRPKWTLSKFVFDESNHKSTNEIKQILNYIFYYKYLIKIITSYINTKKILSMNVEEFDALLNKADKLGVESYLPNIISTSLKSMAEFFNIGEVKKFRIPLMALELFLEEKELFKQLDALNETFGNDENAKFNIYDFQRVLSGIMVEKAEAPPESKETTQFEIVPTQVDLQEDAYTSKETEENAQAERVKKEEIIDSIIEVNQSNEIIEAESEEELILQKYKNDDETEDEQNEQEVFSNDDNPALSNLKELTRSYGDEPSISEFQDNKNEESDEQLKIFTEKNINNIVQDEEPNKPDESVQSPEPIFRPDFIDEKENVTELGEDIEKETNNDSIKENENKFNAGIEEISTEEEEIRIKLNTKFRIRVNDDNRIEPIIDEPFIKHDSDSLFGELPEDLHDKFTGGKSITDDDNVFLDANEHDELLKLIPEETVAPDLINGDSEENNPEPDNYEENENVITIEKKDNFEAENNPDKEKKVKINPDPENEYFELTIPGNPDLISIENHENEEDLMFGAEETGNNIIESKISERIPDEPVKENENQSNFKDIFTNEIEVFANEENEERDAAPKFPELQERKIDIAQILEHKDMTKIIEVIFDYDIEDFANTIEEIANCKNINEANILLKDILAERRINRHSKEIEAFRSIIQELFN